MQRTTPLPILLLNATLLAAAAGAAQQQPSSQSQDMSHMEHMQHGSHGGFMQEGMAHAVAKGVKLEQTIEAATHTFTVHEGPLSLPAHTSHMKMPQPPDVFWTIPLDGWLLAYHPRFVDSNGPT